VTSGLEPALDGVEAQIRNIADHLVRPRRIVAYKSYFSRGLVRSVSPDLEYEGITFAMREFGPTSFLKLRLEIAVGLYDYAIISNVSCYPAMEDAKRVFWRTWAPSR